MYGKSNEHQSSGQDCRSFKKLDVRTAPGITEQGIEDLSLR